MGSVPYDGEARQPNILAPCIIFAILSPLAVVSRFYSRRLAGVGLWWDDWLVLVALPIALGFNVLMLWGLSVGFGAYPAPERAAHLQDFFKAGSNYYFKALYASELIYNTSLPLIKVSILVLYRRVFPTRFMTIGVWTLGILNLFYFISTELIIIFQCHPIHKAWNHKLPYGKCFELRAFLLGQALTSIIIDVLTICLPIHSVLGLNMPLKRRLLVCAVFLVGIFAITCSIIRVPYSISTLNNNTPYTDLYVFEPGNIWSLAELHTALICACLPTILPIFTRRRDISSGATPSKGSRAYNPSGYRRTESVTTLSTSRNVDRDNDAELLTDDMGRGGGVSKASARYLGEDVRGDNVEMGRFEFGMPERDGVGVRKDVHVFADEHRAGL